MGRIRSRTSCTAVAALLLPLAPLAARAQGDLRLPAAAAAAPVTLERVDVVAGAAPAVVLHLSAVVPVRPQTLGPEGTAPHRIYVDLAGTRLGPAVAAGLTGSGSLLRVRTGQFTATTSRVVLDLAHGMPFAVRERGATARLELRPEKATAPAALAAAAHPPTRRAPASNDPVPAPRAEAPAEPPTPARAPSPPPPAPPAPSHTLSAPSPPVRARHSPPTPRPTLPLVVLDAGHGGHDPGAEGVGGVREKDVALDVTRRLAARLLARLPVAVVMTRVDDSFLPITERLLAGEGATLFLSLHANACADPSPRGVEVFYGGGRLRHASLRGADPRAALLGRSLAQALRARVGPLRRRAEPADFGVLSRNPAPSALIEVGYLTHPGDAARARDGAYQELLADALVDGVAMFLHALTPSL
jgi:N-acetylmuramoyl-L-alanine amidase